MANTYEEVEDFLAHYNENVIKILRRRRDAYTFAKANTTGIEPITGKECHRCIGWAFSLSQPLKAQNQVNTDDLIYRFACMLNNANEMGLAKQVDIYFSLGDLAMVVDYDGDIGAVPNYIFDPSRNIKLCLSCASELDNIMSAFCYHYSVDWSNHHEIKEPEC